MTTAEENPEFIKLILQLEKWRDEGELACLQHVQYWLDENSSVIADKGEDDEEVSDSKPVDPAAACAIHLKRFKQCHPERPRQKTIGRLPQAYLDEINRVLETNYQWPDGHAVGPMDRQALLSLCRDSQVASQILYAAIMAWGGRNYPNLWKTLEESSQKTLVELITYLRGSTADRRTDFAKTNLAAKGINGLGVSYFTKLMFFLRPVQGAYILDQFTAKSSILLFPNSRIVLNGSMPHGDTSEDDYEWFCLKIEELGRQMDPNDHWPGDVVESAMFDERGGLWRAYVREHFPKKNPKILMAKFWPGHPPQPFVKVETRGLNLKPVDTGSDEFKKMVMAFVRAGGKQQDACIRAATHFKIVLPASYILSPGSHIHRYRSQGY